MNDVVGYIGIEGRQGTVLRVPDEVVDGRCEVVPGIEGDFFILFPESILMSMAEMRNGASEVASMATQAAIDFLEDQDLT